MMDNLFWIGFVGAAIAIAFAWLQSRRVMTFSEGSDKMAKIAASIREGANAYLKHQYTTVAKVFLVVFLVLLVMAFATGGEMLSQFTPFAFLTGGIWSMLAGFVGMKIATSSNARTAQAASESLNKGLRVAFSSGSVMGFTVVGLGMLDISIWFVILRFVAGIDDPLTLGNIMVMNGMGASFMALFARVGGGIYTKAADVGADLVGKVEAGIPEDDPRNPATIADNVGDNVGDVAGMGADLYESYVGSILATFALGAVAGYGWAGMILPMMLAVCGIVCSIIGSFFVKTKEDATQKSLLQLPAHRHLSGRRPLRRGRRPPDLLSCWGTGASTSPSSAAWSAAAPSATSPSITPPTPTSPPRSWPTPLRPAPPPSSSAASPWA